MTVRDAVAAIAGLLLLLCIVPGVRADAGAAAGVAQSETVELEVKAAYLYKFANYVDWPDDAFRDAVQPIVIGVFGADALAAELKNLVRGKRVKGRAFLVRRLRAGDDPRDLHILFLGGTERDAGAGMLAAVGDRKVLTVSDSAWAFTSGSMVNLVIVDQRVRFEVAMPPVQRSGLRLSALMLTAAYRVQKDGP